MPKCTHDAAQALDFTPFCQCDDCQAKGPEAVSQAAASRQRALDLIYREMHSDYAGRLQDGRRAILVLRGGTVLCPLDALTDAEILDKLGSALRLSARRRAR